MEKMHRLLYTEDIKQISNKDNPNLTTFVLKPLERGFGNTIAVPLRRVLLSNITSLALFAVAIEGVEHEFQTINGIIEDVPTILMNLRQVRFQYDSVMVKDDEIIKAELKVNSEGLVTARNIEINNPAIEILNQTAPIANIANKGSLHLEMYLKPGRGFVSNEENKKLINNSSFVSKAESKIKNPVFIATDSNFSPVVKVNYTVEELNSSSNKIEEELRFSIETDGTVSAKEALKQASEILFAHFEVIGDIDKMNIDVFSTGEETKTLNEEKDIDITQLNLSVRSLNALRRIGKTKVSEVASMTKEELEQTKNLGKKSIEEIQNRLKEYNYMLSKGDE